MDLFYIVGELIPIYLLFFCTIYWVGKKRIYGIFFVVMFAINVGINLLLKRIIKEDRPVRIRDDYGMPSGHSQACTFITTLMYLMTRNTTFLYVFSASSFVCFYHRYHFSFHSIPQIVVGAVLGTILGFGAYQFWPMIM